MHPTPTCYISAAVRSCTFLTKHQNTMNCYVEKNITMVFRKKIKWMWIISNTKKAHAIFGGIGKLKINDDGTTGTFIMTRIKIIISYISISITRLSCNLIYLSVFFTFIIIILQCVAMVHFKSESYFDLQNINKNIITIRNIYSYNPPYINRWDTRICLIFDEYHN